MDCTFTPVGATGCQRSTPLSPSVPHLNRKPIRLQMRSICGRTDPMPKFEPSGSGRDMFCSATPPSSFQDRGVTRGVLREVPVVYADTIAQREMALSGRTRASTPALRRQQATLRRAQSASSLRLSSMDSTASMRFRKRKKFDKTASQFGASMSRRSIFSDEAMLARTLHGRPAGS